MPGVFLYFSIDVFTVQKRWVSMVEYSRGKVGREGKAVFLYRLL